MSKLFCMLLGLLLAVPALADTKDLYHQVLQRLERIIPPEGDLKQERRRLEVTLEPLLAAYAGKYPNAPRPRLRLVVSEWLPGTASALDSGLILVNPYMSAQLSGPVLAGMLAHELAHMGLEHGWARARMAYDSVSGTRSTRLALAMTGNHPLKGSPAWSRFQHEQEYRADREGRDLLVLAGLPASWVGDAIPPSDEILTTESHPTSNQRLLALAAY